MQIYCDIAQANRINKFYDAGVKLQKQFGRDMDTEVFEKFYYIFKCTHCYGTKAMIDWKAETVKCLKCGNVAEKK